MKGRKLKKEAEEAIRRQITQEVNRARRERKPIKVLRAIRKRGI